MNSDSTNSPEDTLPDFPALSKCMVVDSRFSSRLKIVSFLAATNLFQDIVEPSSLGEAMTLLRQEEFDVSCVGPSVTTERAADFIRVAKDTAKGDCAFVAFVTEGTDQSEELQAAGAHGVITYGCQKKFFYLGIISAVTSANANSPWCGIPLEMIPRDGLKSGSGYNIYKSQVSVKLDEAALDLQQLIDGFESGVFGLSKEGVPTVPAREAISKLVAEAIPDGIKDSEQVRRFRKFFEAAVSEWFVELFQGSKANATDNLKKKLAAYKQ